MFLNDFTIIVLHIYVLIILAIILLSRIIIFRLNKSAESKYFIAYFLINIPISIASFAASHTIDRNFRDVLNPISALFNSLNFNGLISYSVLITAIIIWNTPMLISSLLNTLLDYYICRDGKLSFFKKLLLSTAYVYISISIISVIVLFFVYGHFPREQLKYLNY